MEDLEGVPEERQEAYAAMLRDVSGMDARSLDLSGVTRSSGYLWPLPYTEYGSDVLLGEGENNTLRILSPEGMTVQSVAGGRVKAISVHPITGEQTVYVVHPDGWNSEYGHLEYVEVKDGAEIKRGEVIGTAREEEGRRWLNFRLLRGSLWDTAASVDPWSAEYRTYDFLPVTRESVTIAGDGATGEPLSEDGKAWLDLIKPEHEEMQWLFELSEQPSLDMEGVRYFSPEELTELEYGGTRLFGKPLTHTMGFEFAPIQGAPSTPEALRQRLEEQFTPELADEEYRFALEGSRPRCLFAEGKMWRRMVDWTKGLHWEYDWSTFQVVDSGEDFVSYQISGYRSDEPETEKPRYFTLQLEREGDAEGLWRYSKRE